MVKINSEHRDSRTEISDLRLSRQVDKLQSEYNEREAKLSSRLSTAAVLNGDPPALMLWGEE